MKFRDTFVTHSIFHFIDNHRDKKWLTNTRYKLLPLVLFFSNVAFVLFVASIVLPSR